MAKAVWLYHGGFSSVSCFGDPTCIISALEKNAMAFNPYMHARLSEIQNFRYKISWRTHIEEVFHIASSENVADICTRRESSLKNLGPRSVWQSGPLWLHQPCHSWPCNRDFTYKDLPSEETKTPLQVVLAAKVTETSSPFMVQFAMKE